MLFLLGSRAVLSILRPVCHCIRSPCFCQCFGLLLAEHLEGRRENSHLGSAWDNMNTIVGLKERGRRKLEFEGKPDSVLAEDLNRFYVRFDTLQ